jgi:hypothetical protein
MRSTGKQCIEKDTMSSTGKLLIETETIRRPAKQCTVERRKQWGILRSEKLWIEKETISGTGSSD